MKGVGLAATLIGGFAGGFVARAYPLATCLWIGAFLQMASNLVFTWLAFAGQSYWALTAAIIAENFTGAIGTVIFVAYLSALCQSPLHTATQYALLTALAAVGRTYLSSGAGFARRGDRLGVVLHRSARWSRCRAWCCCGGCRCAGISKACTSKNLNARQSSCCAWSRPKTEASGSRPKPSWGDACLGNTCHFSRLSHSNGSPSH